jgi:hypothetical protein
MSATALTLAAGRPEVDNGGTISIHRVNSSGSFTNDLSHFYNSISSPTSAPGTQVRRTFDFTGFRDGLRCRRPPSRLLLADRKWIWRYNFYPINSSGSFTNDLSHFYNSISSPTSAPGTQVRRTLDFTGFAMSATALTLAAGRPEVEMAVQFLSNKLKWVIYKRPKSFLQFNIVTDFSTGYTSPSYLRFYVVSRFRRPPSRLLLADRKWIWRYNFYPINSSGSFTNDLSHFYNSISSPTSAPGTQVRRTLDFTGFAMSATALTLAAGRPEVAAGRPDMAVQFLSYKLKLVIY